MYLPSRLPEDTGLHSDTSRRVGLQIEGLIANANVNAKINASNGESMEVNFWKKSWSETQNNTSVLAFFYVFDIKFAMHDVARLPYFTQKCKYAYVLLQNCE